MDPEDSLRMVPPSSTPGCWAVPASTDASRRRGSACRGTRAPSSRRYAVLRVAVPLRYSPIPGVPPVVSTVAASSAAAAIDALSFADKGLSPMSICNYTDPKNTPAGSMRRFVVRTTGAVSARYSASTPSLWPQAACRAPWAGRARLVRCAPLLASRSRKRLLGQPSHRIAHAPRDTALLDAIRSQTDRDRPLQRSVYASRPMSPERP